MGNVRGMPAIEIMSQTHPWYNSIDSDRVIGLNSKPA